MQFALDSRLKNDSIFITDLNLCSLRLIDNSNFPWVILIPKISPNIIEITDLRLEDFHQLNNEILSTAKLMRSIFKADKLNIATIGNAVSQMHYHIIARYKTDKLFPKTVWGDKFNKYNQTESTKIINLIKEPLPNYL